MNGFPDPDSLLDRDLDVRGTRVATVAHVGSEILLSFNGGTGWWVDSAPGRLARISTITEMTFASGMNGDSDEAQAAAGIFLRDMARLLEHWRDEGTLLRVTSAPNCPTYLIRRDGRYVLLPRT